MTTPVSDPVTATPVMAPAYQVTQAPWLGPVLDLRDLRDVPLPDVAPPPAVTRRYAADGWTVTRYVVAPDSTQYHLARYLLVVINDGAGRSAGIAVNSDDSSGGVLDRQTLQNLGLPHGAEDEMHYPGSGRLQKRSLLETLLDLDRWLDGIDPATDPHEYDAALLGLTQWVTMTERSWADVRSWQQAHVSTPFRLRMWRTTGFSDETIRRWAPVDPGAIKARAYAAAFRPAQMSAALAWFEALPDLSPILAAAATAAGWDADTLAQPLTRAIDAGAALPQPVTTEGESAYDAAVSALIPYAKAGLDPHLAVACLAAGISPREAAARHAEDALGEDAVAALAALRA